MKKITLQLKSVGNPKNREKPNATSAYLNILRQQPPNVKISKLSPNHTESSPKGIPNISQPKIQRKPSNQIEAEKTLNRETNKSVKNLHQPAIYTLNLNVEVEKPIPSKEMSPRKTKELDEQNKEVESQQTQDLVKSVSTTYYCSNHPTKKAKYFKLNEDTLSSEDNLERQYYCSKCAINYALKGIRMFDIQNPEPMSSTEITESSKRQEIKNVVKTLLTNSDRTENNDEDEFKAKKLEIESFIAELETVQNSGAHSLATLNQKRKEIGLFYEKQIKNVEESFANIIENLQKSKKNILGKMKAMHEENECLMNSYQIQISTSLKDMNYIHSDISQNLDNIIKTMDRKPFTIILNKYQQKLKNYENIYQNLNKERVLLSPSQFTLGGLHGRPFKMEEEIWKIVNPFKSPQDFLKINENNIYVSFDDKEAFEKSPNSVDKTLIRTERNTPNKILNTNVSDKENAFSPNTQKYLKLLQKVSNNQESTNIFVNNVMRQNPLRSSESCKNLDFKLPKEEKDFQNFFTNLEKRVEFDDKNLNNYQKHLFRSPHFRDKVDL